jgi:hypothetical protein
MSEEQVYCYVGMCACGCGAVRAASVDKPAMKEDNAQFVADLIREGHIVGRIPVEDARARFGDCKSQGRLQL